MVKKQQRRKRRAFTPEFSAEAVRPDALTTTEREELARCSAG
jgi:hypothetical protein